MSSKIIPEWYFLAPFNLLRIILDKFLGCISLILVPLGLFFFPYIENLFKYQNPYQKL